MKSYGLTPVQKHLLKLFSFDHSEDFALEVKDVLNSYLQTKLDAQLNKLWDDGVLNQDKLDEIRKEDLHQLLKKHGKNSH